MSQYPSRFPVQQTLYCTLGLERATLWVGQVMKRILIADDNPAVRRGLRDLIANTDGWDVCGEAVNGREAIERARELHPDMLLLDLVMPGMNGFDTARELARVEPNLPILLCTVQLSPYVVREAEKVGIQGAVSKSKVSQITDGISAVLRHETFYCWPAD
jgi:DNA-binding NarL/FixJ family response regulator